MSLEGHKPRRRSGLGASLCPQYLQSRLDFVHRSERRQVHQDRSRTLQQKSLLNHLVGAHESVGACQKQPKQQEDR
jgi:hypothetical protein